MRSHTPLPAKALIEVDFDLFPGNSVVGILLELGEAAVKFSGLLGSEFVRGHPIFSQTISATACRSAGGRCSICSRICAALMVSIYPDWLPAQARVSTLGGYQR